MSDQRFKIAHREAWIGVSLAIIHFLWWFGFAYGFGRSNVKDYKYILGLPEWFFYSCVLGFILIVVLVFIAVKYFFKEVPFEDEESGGQ
ncbi:sodium:pantothenate symporter [Heyndrickxia sporothermodurans]|nr:sodium:pantothenate symporter [Heyndrickxia sporothermodurans]